MGLDSPVRARVARTGRVRHGGVGETRNPMLLFVLSGVLLRSAQPRLAAHDLEVCLERFQYRQFLARVARRYRERGVCAALPGRKMTHVSAPTRQPQVVMTQPALLPSPSFPPCPSFPRRRESSSRDSRGPWGQGTKRACPDAIPDHPSPTTKNGCCRAVGEAPIKPSRTITWNSLSLQRHDLESDELYVSLCSTATHSSHLFAFLDDGKAAGKGVGNLFLADSGSRASRVK